jgi:hypothetical protein
MLHPNRNTREGNIMDHDEELKHAEMYKAGEAEILDLLNEALAELERVAGRPMHEA